MFKKILTTLIFFLSATNQALAHCPLCTAGVGAAAGVASVLGVEVMVLGLFVGGFSLLIGFMVDKAVTKKFFKLQKYAFGFFSFIVTMVPLRVMFQDSTSIPVYFFGSYGSLLYRTYIVNEFLFGGVIGASLISFVPVLSKKLSEVRGDTVPFQTMIMTFTVLLVVGLLFQFL